MTTKPSPNWRIGTWTLYTGLYRIDGPDGSHRLAPKTMETLICLAEHQGEIVSREMLFTRVWTDTIVSDDTLNRAISDLRSLFKDTPKQPHVIETIRLRGYRLLLPAHPIPSPDPATPNFDPVPGHVSPKQRRRTTWIPYAGWFSLILIVIILGVTAILQKHNSSAPLYRAVPLTTYPGFEFDVALSYDGNQVAFTGTIDSTLQMDLFVKQIEVETPQQLTSDPAIEISPGWSPDGRALAYIKGEVDTSCGLMLMRLPGGDERKLADCHTLLVTGVSWSPDGRTIAYSDRLGHDKPFRIYLLDVQTRAITPLTDPEDGLFGDFSATFSPDGRSVGFIRGTVANTTALNLAPAVGDMYSISLDTKTETRHTFENQEIAHIDWTPDGKHLVFASRWERGIPGLWKVNIQTGMLTWLMGIDGYIRKPMMARRSNRLVFEKWDNEVSIWKAELDTLDHGPLNAKPLIRSTHFDAAPQFSPDGRHLAFISQRSGASEIWISDADGEQSLQLTGIGGPVTSNPRWSPDGRHLTFESRKDGQADIYRINVNGTPVRRLTHHPAQDMIPSWSPDGVWIYFGSNRNGTWQIWKMPGEGGAATQVTTDGGFLALAPPVIDHPYLYYTRLNRSGLFRISLQDGTENRIIPDFSFAEWGNWMPAETGIFFAERLPDRRWSKLLYYDYATELIEEVGRIRGLGIGMIGLTLTPDRRTLAYVRQYNNNSDLWMIDHFE